MRITIAAAALQIFLAGVIAGAAEGLPTLADVLADGATLRGVQMIDATTGWAVGDRGAVLRTEDGGAHWRRVETPTSATLYGVSFLDAQRGWAVGGRTRPYTRQSEGVLLWTDNGGRDWELLKHSPLPALRAARFFDEKRGVAAGVSTAFSPSGVFLTEDGGREWRPAASTAVRRWTGGDFLLDPSGDVAGVVVGPRGKAARLLGGQLSQAVDFNDRRAYRAARMADSANGWLVGDGGLIRSTDDGGRSWREAGESLPASVREWFDWGAVEARGRRAWVAGSPGSCVAMTEDGGETWRLAPTGQSLPIHALEFLDDYRGWAVGEMGTILATVDGGRTWRPQRGGDRRASLLFIVGEPDQLPAELVAVNAAAEGRRTVIAAPLLPNRHTDAADRASRLRDASIPIGADAVATGWRVPLFEGESSLPTDKLVATLKRRTDGHARRMLVERLRNLLVTYRPDALVVPLAAAGDADGLSAWLGDAAVEAASLAKETPPHEVGLEGWSVKRVVAAGPIDGAASQGMAAQREGAGRLSVGDFSALLGATPAQWCRESWGLLTEGFRPPPAAYQWRSLSGQATAGGRRGDLLAGLASSRVGDARRPSATASAERLKELRRLAQKRRNMERLLGQARGDDAWAGQVVDLTGGLGPEAGAELLRQLAEGYRETGKLELAAETYYLLARRYTGDPRADASLLWLIRYYASGERAHADDRQSPIELRDGDALANVQGGRAAAAGLPEATGAPISSDERFERAAKLLGYLRSSRPELAAEPSLRFIEAAVSRSRGLGAAADRVTLLLSKQAIADDWRRAALAERWLTDPKGLPPEKPIVTCRYTPRRPRLDGRLDEAVWRQAEPIRLRSSDADPGAVVRLACDDAFLYLAVEGRGEPRTPTDPAVPRRRDEDLASADRLRLRIDVDRDYATSFELTIDRDGRTRDALWGDRRWDPRWYVASDGKATEGRWRLEAAVALDELANPKELSRAAWAVSAVRLRPGEAVESWTGADQQDSPDAYGLVLFE